MLDTRVVAKNGKLDAQLYWTKKADPFTTKVVTPTVPIQIQCSGVVPMSGTVGSQATNVFPLAQFFKNILR